jgi:hypothetical protein
MAIELTQQTKDSLRALLEGALKKQNLSDALHNSFEGLVLDLAFQDRRALGEKVFDALEDNTVSEHELVALLAFWVDKWPPSKFFGDGFVKKILQNLKDGELSTDEIGDLVSEWVANHLTKDGQLHQLIVAAVQHHLDEDVIMNAVFSYLKRIGAGNVADALKAVLEADEPVTSHAILQIVIAVLIREAHLGTPGISANARNQEVVNALSLLPDESKLHGILKAISEKKFAHATALALDAVGITADEGLLNALLTGGDTTKELQRIAVEKLTPFVASKIQGETAAQAKQVTILLFDLLSGKKPLVAPETEQEALNMSDDLYKTFRGVRRVVYAAVQATVGGAKVNSVAMSQPHIFAAAGIEGSTAIKDLVSADQRTIFLALAHQFAVVEFKKPFPLSPFTMEGLLTGRTVAQIAATIN